MWGCLPGPEKLEAEWRTGAALLCPARKLGPVGSAWPSPWPCGRPAATPACASTPCLWSSWNQKHWSLLVWRPRWRMDWPRWLCWNPLGLGFHPWCFGLSWWCRGSPGQVHATWWGQWWRLGTRWWRLRDFLCGTWGPWCVGGRVWSVRGSGWDGGWLHRGGATGRVFELGRCWRCWFLGGGCCFSGWRGFAGQLLALVLGPKETGGPVGAWTWGGGP